MLAEGLNSFYWTTNFQRLNTKFQDHYDVDYWILYRYRILCCVRFTSVSGVISVASRTNTGYRQYYNRQFTMDHIITDALTRMGYTNLDW